MLCTNSYEQNSRFPRRNEKTGVLFNLAGSASRSFLLPLLFILAGCSVSPTAYTDPRPIPTADQRTEFGNIGFRTAHIAEPRWPKAPDSKTHLEKAGLTTGFSAALAGAGAIAGLSCGPAAPLCVPVMAAAAGTAGLFGGLAGTIPFRSPDVVSEADITLRNSLLSIDVERQLVGFIESGRSRLDRRGTRPAHHLARSQVDLANQQEAIDTWIEIEILEFSLIALNQNQKRNPDVRLAVVADVRVVKNDDDTASFERRWMYDSDVHSYFEWADDEGELVRDEVKKAFSYLGQQIVRDFLITDAGVPAESNSANKSNSEKRRTFTGEPTISADDTKPEQKDSGEIITRVTNFFGGIFAGSSTDK